MNDEKTALAPALNGRPEVTPINLDPTKAMTCYPRDAAAAARADRARQAGRADRLARESVPFVPRPETAARQAQNLGLPVQLIERIITLESKVAQLQSNFDWLIDRKINS